jgi:protein TonB
MNALKIAGICFLTVATITAWGAHAQGNTQATNEKPQGTRAKAFVRSIVSMADYPPSALNHHESGQVFFRLHIGIDGLVTACDIVRSSGSATLDSQTCRIMKSRARFTPAHDGNGNPVEDTVESSLTWTLPAY